MDQGPPIAKNSGAFGRGPVSRAYYQPGMMVRRLDPLSFLTTFFQNLLGRRTERSAPAPRAPTYTPAAIRPIPVVRTPTPPPAPPTRAKGPVSNLFSKPPAPKKPQPCAGGT